jgi:hypothetical protein
LLIGLGLVSYRHFGVGPLTNRSAFERIRTIRGTVLVNRQTADQFHWLSQILDRADPTGRRPLFAFGYSGGYDYFLGRQNPTPLTIAFHQSNFEPAPIVAAILDHQPPSFLVDDARFKSQMLSDRPSLLHWDPQPSRNPFMAIDRPQFETLLAHCPEKLGMIAGAADSRPELTVYSCQPPARGPAQ